MSANGELRLRGDLEIFPAGVEADGGEAYLMHDPLCSTFDRIEWPEYEIVKRLRRGMDIERLHAALTRETTIRVARQELEMFVDELERRGFLVGDGALPVDELLRRYQASHVGWARWLLGHYLYFRVPLLRPDAFLDRTLWLPRLLGSAVSRAVFWMLTAAALYLFLTRMNLFFDNLVQFLSWKNAVLMSFAVVVVKTAHEFSHAYAARLRGARIAAMGVVFMVMFPLPYSDVTDSWRLPRRDRLAISFAGVRTELTIAVLAFLGWTCSDAGPFRDVLFVLCSGSLASTLLTNLNPGMRFDGYYLFSDLIGVDNLQQRAFAYFRRTYRRTLLGIALGEPEAGLSRWRKALMLCYTVYAWLYRTTLYFGIAVAVYVYFPKVLGILLFAAESAMFLVRPAINELRELWRMRKRLKGNLRLAITGVCLTALAFWLACPLPRRIALPAAGVGRLTTTLYAPWGGDVLDSPPERGTNVNAGDTLFAMETRLVTLELRRVESEIEEARTILRLASGDGELRGDLQRAAAAEKRLLAVRDSLRARLDGNRLSAPFAGTVLDADESLRPGLSVAKGRYIATLADRDAGVKIVAYVPEKYREETLAGGRGWFVPDSNPGLRIPCVVERVASVNSSVVEEPFLAERHGGSVVTESTQRQLRPAETMYRLEAAADGNGGGDLRFGQTGTLYMQSGPRSLVVDAARRLIAVLVRESGF